MAQESSVLSASEEYLGNVNDAAGGTERPVGSWLDRLARAPFGDSWTGCRKAA